MPLKCEETVKSIDLEISKTRSTISYVIKESKTHKTDLKEIVLEMNKSLELKIKDLEQNKDLYVRLCREEGLLKYVNLPSVDAN